MQVYNPHKKSQLKWDEALDMKSLTLAQDALQSKQGCGLEELDLSNNAFQAQQSRPFLRCFLMFFVSQVPSARASWESAASWGQGYGSLSI